MIKNSFFLNHLKRLDRGLIFPIILLACFSLLAIYSCCLAKNNFINFYKQIFFFLIGFSLMFLISFFDYRVFYNKSSLILFLYFLSIILLLGLFIFAPVVRGTRGWYKFGFFSFDPNEIVKLAVVILLAKYFSTRHVEMYKFRHIIFSGLYILLPAFLVFKKPDMGGAIIILLIWFGILMVSGIKVKHFLIMLVCFLILFVFSWSYILKDYQKERIISFLFPYDYLGAAWSQRQTQIAIGSGLIFGQGVGKGSQVQYGFLPEPHTDFIFSVIAQEMGLVGVSILFLVYGILVWRVLKLTFNSISNFPRLFATGFAIILISHFFINIGMNLVLLPVIGVYLPFVSYGGSAIIGN